MTALAVTHILDASNGWTDSPLSSMNRAFELVQKALGLDENDPYPHAVLGKVLLYQRKYEKAITEGKQAITLNPNFALGHMLLADTMCYSGQLNEAITRARNAYRLDPIVTPRMNFTSLAKSYIFLGHYDEALEACRGMDEITEKALISSWIYQELGREEEARAHMANALKRKPDISLELIKVSSPYKDPALLQRELDALRKAGMPEHPPGAVQEKPSIAVLPFDDLSPEKDQEYFVLGLSEEILNSLAQIPDLTVIAKTSSFSFKGKDKTIQEIASVLDVDHILEGSVRKAGNALRITAQLIKTDDGSHLWSETYDRELKDIFKIQENIANNVADKMKLTLEAFQLLGGTENIQAYELYLIARGKVQENNDIPAYRSALELLDEAIVLDPEFALAWAYKAHMHLLLNLDGPASRSIEEADACIRAAQNSIELEPNLGDAYISLGWINMSKNEWIEAELNYRKALELLDKSLSGDHQEILPFYLAVGKFKKAYEILKEMRLSDPINQGFLAWYYVTYGLLADRQRAEEEYQSRNKTLSKSDSDWHDEAITQARLGSGDVISRDEIVSSNPINVALKEYLDSPKAGRVELRQIYSSDNNLSSRLLNRISIQAAYFGDHEFALEALEKGTKISGGIIWVCWFPVFQDVRQLPRFKEFMREIGLVDYWKEYSWPDLCRPVGDDDFVCD
jgi:TolB-like protein/predicted Zn-dependent protease